MRIQRSIEGIARMPSPPEIVAALEEKATRHETASGDGAMVWRHWAANGRSHHDPLVLLHGGSGSWRHWIRNIDALSTDRDVWAPDLPGFGDSALPHPPTHFSTIAATVCSGLRVLLPAEQRFDLAGFSFGSHTSQYVAAEMGGRVATLVLVTGHMLGPMLAQPNQILERWRDIADPPERERILKRNLGALMLAHETSMDPLALHLYAEDVTRSRVRPPKFINDRDYGMIDRLPCNVAGIAGALDPLGVPSAAAQGAELLRRRPDARFHLVENAGHWVSYEAPGEFNRVLRDFLGG